MDAKTIEQLITCRSLLLFLYNFKSSDIDELCQDDQFKYHWNKLTKRKKKGVIDYVDFTDFYEEFSTQMSYKTQALVLKKATDLYEVEARKAIEFSASIELVFIQKRGEE